MTALPLRPALADVLAVLSVRDPQMSDEEFRRLIAAFIGPHWPFSAVSHRWESGPLSEDWITRDPAEAFEVLIARGVLPDAWAGDVRRAWACAECTGVGVARRPSSAGATVGACPVCVGARRITHSPTIPELVAWASLGPAAILRAEELALHGAHLLTIRPPIVVWRVAPLTPMPRETMLWQVERQRVLCRGANAQAPCDVLYELGLAWVYADDHAVTITVPPIGGAP